MVARNPVDITVKNAVSYINVVNKCASLRKIYLYTKQIHIIWKNTGKMFTVLIREMSFNYIHLCYLKYIIKGNQHTS